MQLPNPNFGPELKIDFDEEINKNVEFVIHSSEEFIITGISIKR